MSLVLIIMLTGVTFWIYSKISSPVSAAPPAISWARPLKLTSAPTPIAALTSVETPAPLGLRGADPPLPLLVPVATPAIKANPFFLIHPVQAGETLISIAAKYNLTTEKLLTANKLRDPTQLVRGWELLIPLNHQSYPDQFMPHRFKAGETLLSLAVKYGSSVKAIRAANSHLEFDSLMPGETLVIPVIFNQAHSITATAAPAETVYHLVQKGETPSAIAAAYDLPLEILLAANHILDPTRLQIGQKLIIPPHTGINGDFPVILYELAAGDTLVGLASRFNSSVKDILAVNPELDPALAAAGQQVAIPVIFSRPASPSSTSRPVTGPPPALLDLQQQLIAAVNEERQKYGLAVYRLDEQLDRIALAHAQDMIGRDFLAHVTPDGKTLADRLVEGGVEGVNSRGENIQRNARPYAQAAEAAVAWFMNSAPHRFNLLHEQYHQMGVAVVEGPPGWYTFVLVFVER